MKSILSLQSSIQGDDSFSRKISAEFIQRLQHKIDNLNVVERDLATNPVPYLNGTTTRAIRGETVENSEQQQAIDLSDELLAELKAADAIVLAAPRYNFHVPATLSSYFDYIIRPGETFSYTENGPQGLLNNIPVYVVVASGGYYTEGEDDFLKPWLRQVLGFIGLTHIEFINIEGVGMGEAHIEKSLTTARETMDTLLAQLKLTG